MTFPTQFHGIHFDPNAPGNTAVVDPPASPAGPVAPAVPASPADGSVVTPPVTSPDSVGLKQLREQYEATKGKLEPWEKLNARPEDVASQFPIIQKMATEAKTLGAQLGYDAKEVEEFFAKDPVQVLAYLRQQAQTREKEPLTQADLKKELDRMVEDRLKPITAREDARMNKEAEFKFNGEFERLFNKDFKDGLPDEVKTAIFEMVGQLVGEDPEAIKRLKFEGQVADVAKHFEAAKNRVLKIFSAWSAHERKRAGNEPPPPPGRPNGTPSKMDVKISTGQTVRELFNS
jgi:hypothetical protein